MKADTPAFSPDGRNVYVAAWDQADRYDAVLTFRRDPGTGTLRELRGRAGCITNHRHLAQCTAARALSRPLEVVISPDGRSAYVDGYFSDGVAVLRRSPVDGSLAPVSGHRGCVTLTGHHACARARGLNAIGTLSITADGRNLYGLSVGSTGALVTFARAPF